MGREHKWIHNNGGHARNGELSYSGMTAYSFATAIACKYPDKKDPTKGTVIFSDRHYSSRTTRHQSWLRRAIPDSWDVVCVETPGRWGEDHVSTLKAVEGCLDHMYWVEEEAARNMKECKTGGQRAKLWTAIKHGHERIEKLAKFLRKRPKGLRRLKLDTEALDEAVRARELSIEKARPAREAATAARRERQRLLREAQNKERRENENRTHAEIRERWIAGVNQSGYAPGDVMLRFTHQRARVQTSMNCEISFVEAAKLFRTAKRVADIAISQDTRTKLRAVIIEKRPRVGLWTLTDIKDNGDVKVGCHYITFAEMERLFNLLPEDKRNEVLDAKD